MNNTNTPPKYLIQAIRWPSILVLVMVELLAIANGAWLTCLAAAIFCFFLVLKPEDLKDKVGIGFVEFFVFGVVVFLGLAYLDANFI